jgi:hypothetical protein
VLLCIIILILYNWSKNRYTILCHTSEYSTLCEYIESAFPNNEVIKYDIDTKFKVGNYITLRRIPILSNSLKPPLINWRSQYTIESPILPDGCNIIYLNVDHLTNIKELNYIKKYLDPKIKYYDFSKHNIKIYGKGKYIPYKENIAETKKLIKYINVKKEYDICLVGEKSQRRQYIVKQLRWAGYIVIYISNLYRDERDIMIGKSKILLNIHSYSNRMCYESIRCERWRFANMQIICENCDEETPSGIIVCTYDNVLKVCQRVLNSNN